MHDFRSEENVNQDGRRDGTDDCSLLDEVDGPAGYSLRFALDDAEVRVLKSLIESQWLDRLRQVAPEHHDAFAAVGIDRYHEVSHRVEHSRIWSKKHRILPQSAVCEILQMTVLRQLRHELGNFTISGEEEVGWEEIYWRLVRPRQQTDVGPLHADVWFWQLGHGTTPPGVRRIKVWIAIVIERGRNGLRVVPGSHLREWQYHGEHRDGTIKPQIDEKQEDLNPQLVPMDPGQTIVFHDSLLHGGAENVGERTRVSVEFTMFVPA